MHELTPQTPFKMPLALVLAAIVGIASLTGTAAGVYYALNNKVDNHNGDQLKHLDPVDWEKGKPVRDKTFDQSIREIRDSVERLRSEPLVFKGCTKSGKGVFCTFERTKP